LLAGPRDLPGAFCHPGALREFGPLEATDERHDPCSQHDRHVWPGREDPMRQDSGERLAIMDQRLYALGSGLRTRNTPLPDPGGSE
jgi:hypothetical protein